MLITGRIDRVKSQRIKTITAWVSCVYVAIIIGSLLAVDTLFALNLKQQQTKYNRGVLGNISTSQTGAILSSVFADVVEGSDNRVFVSVGIPYHVNSTVLNIGSVISPSVPNKQGLSLSDDEYNSRPKQISNKKAYWSPHSEKLYAVDSGEIHVTWENKDGTPEIVTYDIGFGLAKKSRKIYWNTAPYKGPEIDIPGESKIDVKIVWNEEIPEEVSDGQVDSRLSLDESNHNKTLWQYEIGGRKVLNAQNVEGRVFVEYLGEPIGGKGVIVPISEDEITGESITTEAKRRSLGFDIIELVQYAVADVEVMNIGEQILPPRLDLIPKVEDVVNMGDLYFEYKSNSRESASQIYGVSVTASESTEKVTARALGIYWMEATGVGVQFPAEYRRFSFIWPDELKYYSHYVRTDQREAVSFSERKKHARDTGVDLPVNEVPVIDEESSVGRAFIEQGKFFTVLDSKVPTHRTLLRFTTEEGVDFQRVYSFLDTETFEHPNDYEIIVDRDDLLPLSAYSNSSTTSFFDTERYQFTAVVMLSSDKAAEIEVEGEFNFAEIDCRSSDSELFTVRFGLVKMPENKFVPIVTYARPGAEVKIVGNALEGDTLGVIEPGQRVEIVFEGDEQGVEIRLDGIIVTPVPPHGITRERRSGAVIDLRLAAEDAFVEIEEARMRLKSARDGGPKVFYGMAPVGGAISAPTVKPGSESASLLVAGYVDESKGDFVNKNAYFNPFSGGGLERSAIIPVNSSPENNKIQVWWLREQVRSGFQSIFWPSILGVYETYWPDGDGVLVLASDVGYEIEESDLNGSIYYQNERGLMGYNPNEEHAHIVSGEIFPLRDDLNIVSGEDFSSKPYVLYEYMGGDGKVEMKVLKVVREKGGGTPYYSVETDDGDWERRMVVAGQPLAPPKALSKFALPASIEGEEMNGKELIQNYNGTVSALSGEGNMVIELDTGSRLLPFNTYCLQGKDELSDYMWFHALKVRRSEGSDEVRDLIDGYVLKRFPVGVDSVDGDESIIKLNFNAIDFPIDEFENDSIVLIDQEGRHIIGEWNLGDLVVETTSDPLVEPTSYCLQLNYADVDQKYLNDLVLLVEEYDDDLILLVVDSLTDGGYVDREYSVRRSPALVDGDSSELYMGSYGKHTLTDRNGVLWAFRGPHSRLDNPVMDVEFYYPTQPGFWFPEEENQPDVGTLSPYLRLQIEGGYYGIPSGDSQQAMPIPYIVEWPDVSDMQIGQTITSAVEGLPAIRGQSSLKIIYEQSQVENFVFEDSRRTAVLFDGTRERVFRLGEDSAARPLESIPSSIETELYQGITYFPGLPPHLENRFFFDPARSEKGDLVFRGEFVKETTGSDYLLVNVLSEEDVGILKSLVGENEENSIKEQWEFAIEHLEIEGKKFVNREQGDSNIRDENSDELIEILGDDEVVDSYALTAIGPGSGYVTLISGNGPASAELGDPVGIHVLNVTNTLYEGELITIEPGNPLAEKLIIQQVADLQIVDLKSNLIEVEWRIASPSGEGTAPTVSQNDNPGRNWRPIPVSMRHGKFRTIVGDSGNVESLGEQYMIMRYQVERDGNSDWSSWTEPVIIEGWIKRVLDGINPFNQRTDDLYNNAIDSDISMLTLAGARWDGDVALNSEVLDDYGLIEIYETVLNRGRKLSVDNGVNYGPANDALLLAAGYLNDLYMFHGNEALSDSKDPTIGISTADGTFGNIATSLFAFKGQVADLLEEELGLIRGRDDFLPPGVEKHPFYNRLFWNYTRGINSGEVIYALNYNIQESPNHSPDGLINAEDAAVLYPQGHGDAYGHFLTGLKNYYSLLVNRNFEWVPRTEGLEILGETVQVDYTDERKFAAAAAATVATGKRAFELTWRQDFESGDDVGWEHLGSEAIRRNESRETVRYWGADHWASRTGQGALIHWVAGNAMLPELDNDPSHEGIQVIDRTTVPELNEIVDSVIQLQALVDNADAHLNPLGLSSSSIAFDLNPSLWRGGETSHFEQVNERAKRALSNAVEAFDDAQSISTMKRRDALSHLEMEARIQEQEIAFENALIEVFGTPYSDDIGPGATYKTGYSGPDIFHYMYVDDNEVKGPGVADEATDFTVEITETFDGLEPGGISYTLDSHGFFSKPPEWEGRRRSPGLIQLAISDVVKARNRAHAASRRLETLKTEIYRMREVKQAVLELGGVIEENQEDIDKLEKKIEKRDMDMAMLDLATDLALYLSEALDGQAEDATPEFVGALGIDPSPAAEVPAGAARLASDNIFLTARIATAGALLKQSIDDAVEIRRLTRVEIGGAEDGIFIENSDLAIQLKEMEWESQIYEVTQAVQELSDARGRYATLVADGNSILSEREVFRKRMATMTQGFRSRDAAFRVFRDEKLERYNALFDLAARYVYLAAKAYDYETGLLGTTEGTSFLDRIVSARALGVTENGEPQFAGSNIGDPGLSSILAEMSADFEALRGRLGLNNPDIYGTTASLRTGNYRILSGPDGDAHWKNVLNKSLRANLLDDEDVVQHCLQIDQGDGLPVPGLVLEFSTEVVEGSNLFGKPLLGGDHSFDISSFATKIFSVGVALEGYSGMALPSVNAAVTGGETAFEPVATFLDATALSATPAIYIIPVGLDVMRSPALGDQGDLRTWSVDDAAIPLPFNIGGSEFSTKRLYQSSDSLPEDLFSIRKHQAFRPVPDASIFKENGRLLPATYTNSRLIGRSVWNTRWKLVIPGRTLLNDPHRGLSVLIDSLRDIKIHFETYSYSGN